MINKIAQAIKGAFAPPKPAKSSIEYFDQAPMRIKHSSLDNAQQPPADGWLSAHGRYNLRNWIDR